ncbi:hypothetical protein [Alteromonas sp. a30]|uniref:hypothetical protein n=1 Tax=Alteromonas sp. a30 TaxID=2730917 RepID=UPI0022826EEB|nr:hypothetical protein [Alteromonas sp. a30]MCY7297453.1 hypothetical protein [Alteromonas sp. a30]
MLIYVNQLEIVGTDSFTKTLRTIAGWLKTITNIHFTNDMLLSGSEYTFEKGIVRSYKACELEPAIYSILLSHSDHSVGGRRWDTEIGLKYVDNKTLISISVETHDKSTLVKEMPVATRPRLVEYLIKNGGLSGTTVGLQIQRVKNDPDNIKALSFNIEHKKRSYPLVFVSNCSKSNKPLVNPRTLQKQLTGLAQVVYAEDEINSYELEGILGRRYSAWDGAVNIIYPSFGQEHCHNRLLLRDSLTEVIESNGNLNQHILSYVTHITNGYNKKQHFSPTDVKAKRQRDSRTRLKQRFSELSDDSEYQSLAEEAFAQLEEQDHVIEQLKKDHINEIDEQMHATIKVEEELEKSKSDYQVLKLRFEKLQNQTSKQGKPILTFGHEGEKYSGEMLDTVLGLISERVSSLPMSSRKRLMLQDILDSNPEDGTKSNYLNELKRIFNNFNRMTTSIRSSLKDIGLEVVEEGTHNHLRFIDDNRNKATFAKTPSDRGHIGSNIIRDAKSALF